MNENEKAPVLIEELIETVKDNIVNDEEFEHRSAYLKMQYENATPDKKNAMDVVMVCLTKLTVGAIIELNDKRNNDNQNVG